jgi:nitrite reductase/ring-hydroxylating ferredoxin subunit
MLTREENDLLAYTGPGTPGGALLRRYWQPVALSEEVAENGAPLPVRVLGEDLVLFRDDRGRPGLLGLHCSHRRADLSYGRVENGGLRCLYHGWLYSMEIVWSGLFEQSFDIRFIIRLSCHEMAGLIFAIWVQGTSPAYSAKRLRDTGWSLKFFTSVTISRPMKATWIRAMSRFSIGNPMCRKT